jgi:hypothetical protein
MFLRTNRIATSTLWLIALSGVSSIVSGADTDPSPGLPQASDPR